MNTRFPDHDTIHAVLSLATRAPSIHNSQPWRWKVGEQSLHLYADRSMQLANTDPDARDLMLSCGASLHHCVVALAALGWQSKVHRFPNSNDPDHLAAVEVYRYPASELDITLAAAIPRRRTDRRRYSASPVPAANIALMGARAARAGVMVRQIESLPKLQRIVAEAARRHATDAGYQGELAAWTGRHACEVGVPARSAPQSDSIAVLADRRFAAATLAEAPDEGMADEQAVVLALGTTGDDPLARLRAGEATSLVLLTATALGLATCPVTEPLEVEETRETIQTEVFGASGYPQMLLRVGLAPVNADPLPATPRRALADVVEQLDGAVFG